MTQIAPVGWYRGIDADGNPLAGGKLYTYEAGTSTPKATFTNKSGAIPNANPVILDADGYADVWLDVGGYKFRLENSVGVLQREVDNIDSGGSTGFASQVVSRSSSFNLSINDKNFVIVCTSALTVSLLPAATAGDGFTAVIVNLSSGNVTIDPSGSETINNSATIVISAGNSAIISTDGLEWYAYGATFNYDIPDNILRIVDNADATKKLAFEVSGISTGTTRTLTLTNTSLAIPANATSPSSLVLAEDTDNGTNTATIIAPTALGANRTYTLPDATGTVLLDTAQAKTITVLTSGTSWSVPANVTQVKYRMVGGGAQGGGSTGTNFQASGGGGGEYAEGYLSVTPSGSVAYAIGAGGLGAGSGANGNNGGNTTFGGITANGGLGGLQRPAGGNDGRAGGLGGTGGSGSADIRIAGEAGDASITNATTGHYQGGGGGSSQLGRGARNPALFSGTATGNAGQLYGGGGSGGFGTTGAGGAGAAGVIILEY